MKNRIGSLSGKTADSGIVSPVPLCGFESLPIRPNGRGLKMFNTIMALILAIAAEVGVPPYFALSIALVENPTLNPMAVNTNKNGTKDKGVFQTNDSWDNSNWTDIETNIRTGIAHIKKLSQEPLLNTWYGVAICYNAGTKWIKTGRKPPESSVKYAVKVYELYNKFTNGNVETIIRGTKMENKR